MSLLSPPLEAFWAIVQKGTVQEASYILGITQTGVTQRIRSLEKQLKTSLFKRSRTGMKLTQEGEILLGYVKKSLENEGMALSKIQKAAFEYNIELGISGPTSILQSRVIPNLSALNIELPHLKFHFYNSELANTDTDLHVQHLKSGTCDLAIIKKSQITNEMDYKALQPERYKMYVSKNFKKKNLKITEMITDYPLIDSEPSHETARLFLRQILPAAKLNLWMQSYHHFHKTTSLALTIALVESGMGYAILPEEIVHKKRDIIDVSLNNSIELRSYLAWSPRNEMPAYLTKVINSIR